MYRAVTCLTLACRTIGHSCVGSSGGLSRTVVTHMHQYLAALFVLACTSMIGASPGALAQSPAPADPDVLIWSDRDLSLRPGGFAPIRETETTLQMPDLGFPDGFFGDSRGQMLICEPGQVDIVEAVTSAYARTGKQQAQQAR